MDLPATPCFPNQVMLHGAKCNSEGTGWEELWVSSTEIQNNPGGDNNAVAPKPCGCTKHVADAFHAGYELGLKHTNPKK